MSDEYERLIFAKFACDYQDSFSKLSSLANPMHIKTVEILNEPLPSLYNQASIFKEQLGHFFYI